MNLKKESAASPRQDGGNEGVLDSNNDMIEPRFPSGNALETTIASVDLSPCVRREADDAPA